MFPRRTQPTFAFYLAISLACLLLGALWLLRPATSTHAQSQPEALGSLSGTVRNEEGNPLPNIRVRLQHYRDAYPERQTQTDATGFYQFFSVLSGEYQLLFENIEGNYASEYREDAHFREDAKTVIVNGNNIVGIDGELSTGGSLKVTLQSSEHVSTTSHFLTLYRQNAAGRWAVYRSIYTLPYEPSGWFDALPAGAYRLCVVSSGGIYYSAAAVECFDNAIPDSYSLLAPNARDIHVKTNEQTEVTITLNDTTQVEGYVLDAEGQPLAGIYVWARSTAYNYFAEQIALTDETGYFRFGYIPAGSYYLVFNASYYNTNEYLSVYYPDAYTYVDAESVVINPATHISVTKQLVQESRIQGKVTLPGGGTLAWANITLLLETEDGGWYHLQCTDFCPTTDYNATTGTFTMTKVPTGTYRILAELYEPAGQTFLSAYYGGDTIETAADVVIAPGETKPNINIVVGESTFDSAISGIVTADGKPVAGIEVGLFSPYSYSIQKSAMPLFSTTTDAQGRYTLAGLAGGSYRVAARDPNGVYANTFYQYTPDPYFYPTNMVVLTRTGTLDGINLALTPGGAIRGHIRTQGGKSPSGFSIQVVPSSTDPYYGEPEPYLDVVSDKNGYFELKGLRLYSYYLRAYPPENSSEFPYIPYFHPVGTTTYPYNIPLLVVEPGKTLEGKDIFLFFQPTSFLPVIGGGHNTEPSPPPAYPSYPPIPSPGPPVPLPSPTPTPAMQ